MAKQYRCRFPNRLLTHRMASLSGPYMQGTPQGCVHTMGNYQGVGKPGSGVSATSAFAPDATSIIVNFSACVNVSGPVGIEYQINGGAWTQVTSVAKISDTQYDFTITTPTIEAGDAVVWRYIGGSGTIVDCAEAQDIGDQQVQVQNQLVPAGVFFLLEDDSGNGSTIFLLEDDTNQTTGFLLEDSA